MCACVAAGALLLSNNLNSIIMISNSSVIKREEIELYEITGEARYSFVSNRKKSNELSEFETYLLIKIGDALRSYYSKTFWINGNYSWSMDGNTQNYYSIWLTRNGIPILENKDKLYHISLHAS